MDIKLNDNIIIFDDAHKIEVKILVSFRHFFYFVVTLSKII